MAEQEPLGLTVVLSDGVCPVMVYVKRTFDRYNIINEQELLDAGDQTSPTTLAGASDGDLVRTTWVRRCRRCRRQRTRTRGPSTAVSRSRAVVASSPVASVSV